jgi:hypothetical protein
MEVQGKQVNEMKINKKLHVDNLSSDDGRVGARRLERERDEAMDKAERYRLEANSFMLQRDEARNELLKCNEYNDELYRKLKTK